MGNRPGEIGGTWRTDGRGATGTDPIPRLDATHQTTFIQEGSCTDRDESGICETGQQDVGIDLDKWEGFIPQYEQCQIEKGAY